MSDLKQRASDILIERRGLLGEYADKENAYVMRLVDIIKESAERKAELVNTVKFYAKGHKIIYDDRDFGIMEMSENSLSHKEFGYTARATLKSLGIEGEG